MPRPVWHLEVPPPRRELLFFWGGASREGGGIRRNLWKYHANTTGFFVPISDFGHRAPPDSKTENVRFDHWMPRSVFCGSPPGWNGGDSNRYLPALVHGCTSLLRGIGGASACLPQTHLGYPITHPTRGSDASPRVWQQECSLIIFQSRLTFDSTTPYFDPTGCIPVMLLEGEAMPFEETVDWTNSAVRVQREISKSVSN